MQDKRQRENNDAAKNTGASTQVANATYQNNNNSTFTLQRAEPVVLSEGNNTADFGAGSAASAFLIEGAVHVASGHLQGVAGSTSTAPALFVDAARADAVKFAHGSDHKNCTADESLGDLKCRQLNGPVEK